MSENAHLNPNASEFVPLGESSQRRAAKPRTRRRGRDRSSGAEQTVGESGATSINSAQSQTRVKISNQGEASLPERIDNGASLGSPPQESRSNESRAKSGYRWKRGGQSNAKDGAEKDQRQESKETSVLSDMPDESAKPRSGYRWKGKESVSNEAKMKDENGQNAAEVPSTQAGLSNPVEQPSTSTRRAKGKGRAVPRETGEAHQVSQDTGTSADTAPTSSTPSSSQDTSNRRSKYNFHRRSEWQRNQEKPAPTTDVSAPQNHAPEVDDPNEDLMTSLTRKLRNETYECMICFDTIRWRDATWNCKTCFCVLHLKCTQKWSEKSTHDLNVIQWRCPGCQTEYRDIPKSYYCFCEKVSYPSVAAYLTPHSCGKPCLKKRNCPHSCK